MEREPGAVEKICPYNVLLIIYATSCAIGFKLAQELSAGTQASIFEHIFNWVVGPLIFGAFICVIFFFVALYVHFIIKLYVKEKYFFLLITAAVIGIGLIKAFTIKV